MFVCLFVRLMAETAASSSVRTTPEVDLLVLMQQLLLDMDLYHKLLSYLLILFGCNVLKA